MSVVDECIRLAEALIAVIEEETRRLSAGELASSLKSLVSSKVRQAEQLERQLVILKKSDPAAIKATGEEKHGQLGEALQRLVEVCADNGKVIVRRQALSDDLLGAILDEARRVSGATIMRYCEKGGSKPGHRSAAVSIDARF